MSFATEFIKPPRVLWILGIVAAALAIYAWYGSTTLLAYTTVCVVGYSNILLFHDPRRLLKERTPRSAAIVGFAVLAHVIAYLFVGGWVLLLCLLPVVAMWMAVGFALMMS